MARAARLNVYVTPASFYDAVVAVPNQKAAAAAKGKGEPPPAPAPSPPPPPPPDRGSLIAAEAALATSAPRQRTPWPRSQSASTS